MFEKIRTFQTRVARYATVKFEPNDRRLIKQWAACYAVFVAAMFAIGYLLGLI